MYIHAIPLKSLAFFSKTPALFPAATPNFIQHFHLKQGGGYIFKKSTTYGCRLNLPSTRAKAIAQGSIHYYTGKPCKYGHDEIRITSGAVCLICNRENQARFSSTPSGRAYHRAKNNANFFRHSKINRENLDEVQDFYKNCPPGYEVDHIIPRHGKNVCGFDSISNLQYLPKEENRRKKNKVDPLTLKAVVCVLPEYRSYKA